MYVLSRWLNAVAAKAQKKEKKKKVDLLIFDEWEEDRCWEKVLEQEAVQYEAGGGKGYWSDRTHWSNFLLPKKWDSASGIVLITNPI